MLLLTPMMMHPWMKLMLLMLMMSLLIIMIMMIQMMNTKIAKAHSIWVFEVGTCRGHKPIIDQSFGAVCFFQIALIEIYLRVTFLG